MINSTINKERCGILYLGCPMWSHPYWFGYWFSTSAGKQDALKHYAQTFNSVEGNTTFYHLPDKSTVKRWRDSVPDGFRFSFKFHQQISHHRGLQSTQALVDEQLELLTPLGEALGIMLLQLPASFSPDNLDNLDGFLNSLPKAINCAVEVRHLALFAKDENERRLNQILMKHSANRVIMDTRGLFSDKQPLDPIVVDVQSKKPLVPVNVIATADTPVVRFVGHHELEQNRHFLTPWIGKVLSWLDEGKSVYFFLHMPDNGKAPWLAELFTKMLHEQRADPTLPVVTMPSVAQQTSLL